MTRWCATCGARFSNETSFCPNDGTPLGALPEEETQKVDPLIGTVVDKRYRIEQQIGEGGMGMVYLASHTVLGKKMALKVLRGEMAKDADVVQRFMQEAQAATSIGHENIIDISDFGRLHDGTAYFVMEYLDGEALTDLIGRGGAIPMQEALQIIRQIASALGAAHARGIVHRDLKPDNVFLLKKAGNRRFVKVLDFGIAKVGGASSKLTKTGMVFGTPHYMSPEQAAGQSVDHRTDIYALGVIMYEMFTGKVPFDADTFMGILSKHMFEPPIPPSQAGAGNRLGALEDVILKSLAKKPEQRHQSMDELLADLETVRTGGTVVLGNAAGVPAPDNLADSLEPPSRTEMRLSSGGAAPRSSSGKTPLLIAGGVIALLLVGVAIAGAVVLGGDTDEAEDAEPVVAITPVPPVRSAAPDSGALAEAEGSQRQVLVRSDPVGAEVLVGGAMIGNTPVSVPVPEEGEREVVIQHPGHEPKTVRISMTTTESITVTLAPEQDPEPVARSSRRGNRTRVTRQTTMQAEPVRTPMTSTTMSTTSSSSMSGVVNEVVDPWANQQ